MKKIIAAFDNTHYSAGAMQLIATINRTEPVLLTGIFLPQTDYSALWSMTAGAMAGPLFVPLSEEPEAAVVHANIRRFEQFCLHNHIKYRIQKDFFDFTLHELGRETRFADLLIIGSEAFYKNMGTDTVNNHLQDALSYAECPVLLIPEQFEFPQTNILAYDGSASSVYAIKLFAYLFPELCGNKTLVTYLNKDEEAEMPDEKKIRDLVSSHFGQCAYLTLHLDAGDYLATWLGEQKSGILVSGAFGRSATSRLFHHSFISQAITDHQLPVFIAHK